MHGVDFTHWLSVRYRLLSRPSVRLVSDKNNTWIVASVHHTSLVRRSTHTRQCRGNSRLFTRSAATIPAAIMTERTMESSMALVRSGKQSTVGETQTESGRCERGVDIVCEDDGRQSHGCSNAIGQERAIMDRWMSSLTRETPSAQLKC